MTSSSSCSSHIKIKFGPIDSDVLCVEAKLHGESKVIQRCFDDNNDDNKR